MAELVHVSVPDTHQLCDAGEGCFGQIFDAADDTVHQRGQHSCTALEDVRQMGDQGSCPFGDQASRRRDELGQCCGDAGDNALHELDTLIHDVVSVVAEVVHQLGDNACCADDQLRQVVDDALRQSA